MRRMQDPGAAARARLVRLERQEKARAEARAVMDGVAETVALASARGAAFVAPPAGGKHARAKPYRRQAGLEWLAGKGRLTPRLRAAGERYGAAFRRAALEPAIPSTLDVKPGATAPGGPSVGQVLAQGAGRAQARAELMRLRARLMGQADLVGACDRVCGQELTPREAAGGCAREAARLEAVLKVALDLLTGA